MTCKGHGRVAKLTHYDVKLLVHVDPKSASGRTRPMASLITLLLVVEGWLDQLERVGFWCAFRIIRPKDNMLIAERRQSLALIKMSAGKFLRLPESWKKYRDLQTDRREKGGIATEGKNLDQRSEVG